MGKTKGEERGESRVVAVLLLTKDKKKAKWKEREGKGGAILAITFLLNRPKDPIDRTRRTHACLRSCPSLIDIN